MGLDEALRGGEAYANAGADILFIEAPDSTDQMRKIGAAFDVPVLSNQLHGGVSPILPPAELQTMGFAADLSDRRAVRRKSCWPASIRRSHRASGSRTSCTHLMTSSR